VFGVVMSGTLTGDDPLKGWLMGLARPVRRRHRPGGDLRHDRFTFGNRDLAGGIALIPALVGAFGFAELLTVMSPGSAPVKINPFDSVLPKLATWCSTGGPSCARAASAPSSASCPASARTWRPGRPMRGQARQQGAREVRQGLDRGPDGGRDRRQRLRARRR
jgi:hypothetical protein